MSVLLHSVAIGHFLDTDQLLSVLVQIPKQETVCTVLSLSIILQRWFQCNGLYCHEVNRLSLFVYFPLLRTVTVFLKVQVAEAKIAHVIQLKHTLDLVPRLRVRIFSYT